jgi:hypothetical protein
VLLLVIALALDLGGCGKAADRTAERALVMDWKQGTYEGVRLGDSTASVIRVIGRPEQRGPSEPLEPIGEDFYEIGGLTNVGTPRTRGKARFEVLRYRRRVFEIDAGKVIYWGTTDERATTPEGVGVGDSRDLVRRTYRHAHCFVQNKGTEYVPYPICKVRVCPGRVLGFGGEPIKSIWLAAETATALKSCRRG